MNLLITSFFNLGQQGNILLQSLRFDFTTILRAGNSPKAESPIKNDPVRFLGTENVKLEQYLWQEKSNSTLCIFLNHDYAFD